MTRHCTRLALLLLAAALPPASQAAPAGSGHGQADARHQRVIEYWTPARRAAAIPRDLVQDKQGRGYLRMPDGTLVAHGRKGGDQLSAVSEPVPMAKPGGGGGGGDTTPPSISNLVPANNATIGASAPFSAVVTDAGSGVRSVTFEVTYPDGVTKQSFAAALISGSTWGSTLQGFTNGNWSWRVVARDKASGTGNTATSGASFFTVDTGTGGGGGGEIVANAPWATGGAVQTAAGRIYFEMPANSRRTRWSGYVCSGTVANDGATPGRSIIITAGHCVYDDAYKAFARNVLFIPNQDGTTGTATDLNCSNDPLGCWSPTFGLVDRNYTTRTFPDNVAWDYAYYVVNDTGAHSGTAASSNVLDAAAGALSVSFSPPAVNDGSPGSGSVDYTHALGYSYADDPNFMYCAEDMTTEGTANWWLPSCDLSGGASGGPWMQPVTGGNGPIISVNSWGYTTGPGMAGPKLSGTSASCIFTVAKGTAFASVPTTDGNEGVAVTSCP